MRVENPRLCAELPELAVECLSAQPLCDWTSLSVGGTTDILVINDPYRLPELVSRLRAQGVAWRFLGGGSNLLVRDGELPWVALHLGRRNAKPKLEGTRVTISAAADLGRTVTGVARNNLGGMEGLIGVPGSVGGALRMNAGAYGTEIGRFVRAVTVYRSATNRVETVPAAAAGFEYRHSAFAPEDILIAAELELTERPYEEIRADIKVCNQKRRGSQPVNEKSAGCIFKNPPGASAGRMIDELGLKGYRIGGAVVSERHANFFVNRFQATAHDLLALRDFVRDQIRTDFGVDLREEVVIWEN